jgi:DNA-binding NtrC family response regulator
MKSTKLLIVEDDEASLFGYSQYLSKAGHSITGADCLQVARERMNAEEFDAILLDVNLPDGNAIDWIPELRSMHESAAVIVITGLGDVPTAVKAMKSGADNFLTKPVNMEELTVSLQKSLELGALRKKNSIRQQLTEDSDSYFGCSDIMKRVMELASVAAATDTIVMIFGDTGTGKGVLARWIHDHSNRRSETYVEMNCSTLKGDLLRSELFGHTRGSFTTAIKDRAGLFEAADGGTLFLDEIGDMDLEVQAQLLKTIEEKTFRRIGENRLRTSDFRLICATNRDLKAAQDKDAFRKDLYYRICVFPIHLPALCDRKEDLPGLSEHLLRKLGYQYDSLGPEVYDLLKRHSWEGNIRELRNILERACLLSGGKRIETRHVSLFEITESIIPENIGIWNIDEMERVHILKALEHFGGDKNKVCRELGISLSALYRRLEKIQQPAPA